MHSKNPLTVSSERIDFLDRFSTYASGRMPNAQEKFVAARRILKKGDDVYIGVHEESFFKSNTAAADFNKRYLVMMICWDSPTHSTIAPNLSATYRTGT